MKNKLEKNDIKISVFLVVIALVFFIVIGARTIQLAMSEEIDGINLQEFANSRTTKVETLTANRGTIYDKNGDVLAQNVSSYTLIAYLDKNRTTDINNPTLCRVPVDAEDMEGEALYDDKTLPIDCDYGIRLNKNLIGFRVYDENHKKMNSLQFDTERLPF